MVRSHLYSTWWTKGSYSSLHTSWSCPQTFTPSCWLVNVTLSQTLTNIHTNKTATRPRRAWLALCDQTKSQSTRNIVFSNKATAELQSLFASWMTPTGHKEVAEEAAASLSRSRRLCLDSQLLENKSTPFPPDKNKQERANKTKRMWSTVIRQQAEHFQQGCSHFHPFKGGSVSRRICLGPNRTRAENRCRHRDSSRAGGPTGQRQQRGEIILCSLWSPLS